MKTILIGIITLVFAAFPQAITGKLSQINLKNNQNSQTPKLEIIYPKNGQKVNAESIFIIGSTSPESELSISGIPVKLWGEGIFVEVVQLKKGVNSFKIVSKSEFSGKSRQIEYKIVVPEKKTTLQESLKIEKASGMARIVADNTVVRVAPYKSRLTLLLKDTILEINGKWKGFYRFKYSQNLDGWVSSKEIEFFDDLQQTKRPHNIIKDIKISLEGEYIFIKIPLLEKSPFIIENTAPNMMNIRLFKAKADIDLIQYGEAKEFIREIKWFQESNDCVKLSFLANTSNFWGYNYYYEGDSFILRLRKPPLINPESPLKGIPICIDPGHGGSEFGALSPSGMPEKDINLAISQKLKKILAEKGAEVFMTRNSDDYVGLYERVDFANSKNCLMLLSIHNNSLPDGRNPYIEHGSGTYYYHSQALPLAEKIQASLLLGTGFSDYGISYGNFVLTRANEQLAVLVECGFMIHPEEFLLLKTPEFQERVAESISQGLEDFLK